MKHLVFSILLFSILLMNSSCEKDTTAKPKLEINVDNLLGEWEIYEIFSPNNVINFGTGVTYTFGETWTSGVDIVNDTSFYYLGVDQPEKWSLMEGDTFRLFYRYTDDVRDYLIYRLDHQELWLAESVIGGEFIAGTKFLRKDQ